MVRNDTLQRIFLVVYALDRGVNQLWQHYRKYFYDNLYQKD